MSSTPPSSPSSFHPSTRSLSRQSSCAQSAAKSTPYYKHEPTFSGTFLDDETEEELGNCILLNFMIHQSNELHSDDDGAITTTTMTTVTTTVVKSPSCVTIPRFQTPLPTLMKPEMNRCSASTSTLSYSPLSPTKLCQSPAPSTQFDHSSPIKTPVSSDQARNSQNIKTKGKGKAKQPSTPKLSYRIPHPNELLCPGHIFPAPKKWHVVTVGQDVGIFSSWLDAKACIRGVTDNCHVTWPTYAQALEEYRRQYDASNIEIVLLPGSEWANAVSLEDEYGQLDYNEEVEQALCEAEAHAVAEQAYKSVMEACRYKV
ncbi:hypothetical protein EV421DRAFT_1910837 [Armillaria borealis]|uniref:Ribonuclease H1 N-terminal domain-containing protein n=1 Tax=Armillaria borealis TaxID=47425 RepID=A0AA39J0L0_9AGAR|nr:hypothetical protein EV421DRAFT_1910837 [Armillaria borealis]